MIVLAKSTRSRVAGFEFRVLSLGLTRNLELETRNHFGKGTSVNHLCQSSKGRFSF
jgi:hypothetical protein